ncbi:MAG: F0F1 ATP synthase subunit gamma [Alphaproteobacteria bacterium]|nr:F0F1 ATP synthase subunit gamma [Alphaproteobacteria bacterium]
MASLKDLKVRINSVKSTQKITKAMKMVAAAKLRRAREAAENARPYAERMERMVTSLAQGVADPANAPKLLVGTGKEHTHLIVVATGDRGLCGGFNSSITRSARATIRALLAEGKEVKIIAVGKKTRELMKTEFGHLFVAKFDDLSRGKLTYDKTDAIVERIMQLFEAGEFDVCRVIYNHFKSPIVQVVTHQQLIPLPLPQMEQTADAGAGLYEYEPDEETILADLLPRNIGVQIFKALLENAASEQGARMTAMDNATRNAGDMINDLTLLYNRSRQAAITKELIEIISGAEAL